WRPGIQDTYGMIKSILNIDIPEIAIRLKLIINGESGSTLPKHIEIKVFITGVKGQTKLYLGIPGGYPGLIIIIIHYTIRFSIRTRNIFIFNPTNTFTRLFSRIIYLFLCFKNTICNKSIGRMEWMTIDIIPFKSTSPIGKAYICG